MLSEKPLTLVNQVSHVLCACVTLGVLLQAPDMAAAQTWDLDSRTAELSAALDDSVQPVAFVSGLTCNECPGKETCSACGRCEHCCDCGSLLHRWHRRWDGGFDIGVNGASGNSQDLNVVVGFDTKRKSGRDTVTMDVDYRLTQEDTEVTKNRLNALGRFERDIPNSEWNYFSDAWFKYDQFKDYDSKIGLHAGLGVLLRETSKSELTARFGGGTSREFGSANEDWAPEGLAGLACERKLTRRQKLVASLDYFPDVGNMSSFRVHARASWEVVIDEEMNLSLKASAFDDYDSTPSDEDVPNDVDFSLSLHWAF